MKPILFLLAITFLISGCCTQKRCNSRFPAMQVTAKADSSSISIAEFSKDTVTISYLPPDSSWIKLLLECNEKGEVLMRQIESYESGKNVSLPVVSLKNNLLSATCKVDSIEVFNRLSTRLTKQVQNTNTSAVTQKVLKVNELTRFQSFRADAFWILIPLTLILSLLLLKSRIL